MFITQWHLGFFEEEYLPTSRGFDSHFGYWTGKEDYFNHYEITGVSCYIGWDKWGVGG